MAIPTLAQLAPSALQFLCPSGSGSWRFSSLHRLLSFSCFAGVLNQNRYIGTDTYNGDVLIITTSAQHFSSVVYFKSCGGSNPVRACVGRRSGGVKQILRYCNVGKNCSRRPQLISCSCAKAMAEGGKACACATLIHPRAIEDDKTGGRGRTSTYKLSTIDCNPWLKSEDSV